MNITIEKISVVDYLVLLDRNKKEFQPPVPVETRERPKRDLEFGPIHGSQPSFYQFFKTVTVMLCVGAETVLCQSRRFDFSEVGTILDF